MNYLTNAFSIQMIQRDTCLSFKEISPKEIPEDIISAIGHPDTAAVVGNILEREVPCNRISISLSRGDALYVAQLTGGRLPEGSTSLPDDFSLKFYEVKEA
jgi:hypothetical protein